MLKPEDAICTTDEVIATQRRCHEKKSWYPPKSDKSKKSMQSFK